MTNPVQYATGDAAAAGFDTHRLLDAAIVRQVQAEGASSLRAIAAELHAQGVLTPAGKLDWSPAQVQRLLKRENRGSIVELH